MIMLKGRACEGMSPDIFFPTVTDPDGYEWFDDGTIWEAFGDTSDNYSGARAICALCTCRVACLNRALDTKERWGMWGGLTPIERRRIERKDRRKRLKERRAEEKAS